MLDYQADMMFQMSRHVNVILKFGYPPTKILGFGLWPTYSNYTDLEKSSMSVQLRLNPIKPNERTTKRNRLIQK